MDAPSRRTTEPVALRNLVIAPRRAREVRGRIGAGALSAGPDPEPVQQPVPGRLVAGAVSRPRLVDLVDDAVGASTLTLVSAPAGSGKSVLISAWAATGQVPGPLLRVSVDQSGEGTVGFWEDVAEELERAGGVRRDHPGAGPAPDVQQVGSLTRSVAGLHGPVVLVVDEEVPDPTLHDELGRYLEEAWDSVRVVLLTRSEPLLPLHRYRLAGGLAEIRADDLRFTRTESVQLLLREGVHLTEDQLTLLMDKTLGWAAGLAFAATHLSGAHDLDAAMAGFSGAHREVSSYLAREVLDVQPPELRELMLRTCVPDELPIGLFEALSGRPDGREVMGLLAGSNAFIGPVPGSPTTYEYQPLFRDFLRARLGAERPDMLTDLHRVAAHWWAHCGNLHEATVHAAAAGLWTDAARYLVENLAIGQLVDPRLDTVVAPLFEAMPAETPGGPAAIVRAALALRAGAVPQARTALVDGRTQLSRDASATSGDAFSVELLEAALATAELDTEQGLEALRIAERHLTFIVPSEPDLRPELRRQLALLRSGLHVWGGNLYEAKAASLEAAESAGGTGGELALAALAQCALLAAVLGDTDEALVLLDRVDAHLDDLPGAPSHLTAGGAAVACAWLLMERSQVRETRQQVALAEEHRTGLDPVAAILLDVVRARLLHANGDFAGSRVVLATARDSLSRRRAPAWVADWVDLTAAVHAAAEGGPDPDDPEQGRISLEMTQWHGDPPLELQISLSLDDAAFWLREGDERSAVSMLDQALGLASPHQIRRPFTEAPPAVRQLLRNREELQDAHPWLTTADAVGRPRGDARTPGRLREQAGPGSLRPRNGRRLPALESRGVPRPLVVEPLTGKELEVLGYLNDLATTAEIGAAMFISVNTVRTHVRNLLRKLGADRRNDAVRRAWELGLLAAPRGDRSAADPELTDGQIA